MSVVDSEWKVDIRAIEAPTRVEDLTAGLLMFFARPSRLQTWAELFGHEWRHVGVLVEVGDELMVASFGPRRCFRLDPLDILGAYNRVGVARVFPTEAEVDRAQDFCSRFKSLERSEMDYAFSGILVGPLHLMARRRAPGVRRSLMFSAVRGYCRMQRRRFKNRPAYVCSTFVWAVVQAGLNQAMRIPLSAHPDDEVAYATASNATDELYARWLCGPTEIWQSVSPISRADLDLSNLDAGPDVLDVNSCTPPSNKRTAVQPWLSVPVRLVALTRFWFQIVSLLAKGLPLVVRQPA